MNIKNALGWAHLTGLSLKIQAPLSVKPATRRSIAKPAVRTTAKAQAKPEPIDFAHFARMSVESIAVMQAVINRSSI